MLISFSALGQVQNFNTKVKFNNVDIVEEVPNYIYAQGENGIMVRVSADSLGGDGSGVIYGEPSNIPITNISSDGYIYDSGFSYTTNRLNSGKPIVFSDGSINVENMDGLSSSRPGMLLAITTDPNTTINNHGFSDISNISKSVNNVAYASFDAVARFTGTTNYNHYVGYQSRMNHAGSGTISNIYGFYDQPNISGIVTNRMGLRVNDYSGTGTVGANYGVLIGSLTKGTNNWSIYTTDAPSDFGGYVMGRNNFVRYAPLFSTVYNPAFYYSSTSSPTGQIILSKLINSSPLPNSTFFDIELDISSMGVSSNSYQGTVRITFYYQTINSITTNGLTAKVEGTNIDKINDLINSGNIRVAITNGNELQIVLGSVGYVWGNNTAVSVKSIKMTHTGSGTSLWRDGWLMALNNDDLTSTFKIVRNVPTQSTNIVLNSKANDSDVVKLTGNQTVDGTKTFTGSNVHTGINSFTSLITVPDPTTSISAVNLGYLNDALEDLPSPNLQDMVVDNKATWTAGNQEISFTPDQTSIVYDDGFSGTGSVGFLINNSQFTLYATEDLPVYIEGTGFVKYAGHYSPIAEGIDGFTLMPKSYILGESSSIDTDIELQVPNSKNIFVFPESASATQTWTLPNLNIDIGQEIFISNRSDFNLMIEGSLYDGGVEVTSIEIMGNMNIHLVYTGDVWESY